MAGLSYQQGPPLALPLRFFMAAPVFLMLAGAAALAAGPAIWSGRWSPEVLAVTHLLTLGYLGMVMIGALLQMLPVVIGAPVPAVHTVSRLAWTGLAAGTPLLATGLAVGQPVLLVAAATLLAAGLAPFVVAMALSLARGGASSAVAWPMRKAWFGLLATLALGIVLVGTLVGWLPAADFSGLADLHLAWGLGGWVLILVVGVAYQVVPMLQLTPSYPAPVVRWLTWLILVGLAVYSAALLAADASGHWLFAGRSAVAAGTLLFAALTIRLQAARRRKLSDVTLLFWRLGMASLIACVALMPWLAKGRLELTFGVLFILGFAASVVNGMLYKIVPFLAWFHLQSQTQAHVGTIPNMKEFVPDKAAWRHLKLHGASLACLVVGPVLPWPAASVGFLLLVASGLVLWRNLRACRRLFLAHGGRL